MPVQQHTGSSSKYLSIVGGKLHEVVTPETPSAVKREYEGKDKTMKIKYELIHKSVSGRIIDLNVKSTDFGEFLNVVFSDYILSINVESKYFRALITKIAGIDINKEVVLSPFDYEENGTRFIGISVTVDGVKVKNYFYNDTDKKYCNGWPVPTGDTKKFKKSDWTIFYISVTNFLLEQVEKIKSNIGKLNTEGFSEMIKPKEDINAEIAVEVEENREEDEINIDSIPF